MQQSRLPYFFNSALEKEATEQVTLFFNSALDEEATEQVTLFF